MLIKGECYASHTNAKQPATLSVAELYRLEIDGDITTFPTAEVDVSPPIGDLPTRFTFSDGRVFVADRQVEIKSIPASASWVHAFENKLLVVFFASILLLLTLITGYQVGLPYLSQKVAFALPTSITSKVSETVLKQLDREMELSQLSNEQQQEIVKRIHTYCAELGIESFPQIEFRYQEDTINAFALAGGTIVILDDIVELADSPAELDSVILHELGHVVHRHSLISIVRGSILSISVSLLTGEGSGIIDNLASVAVLAEHLGHSREAEREADAFAIAAMQKLYNDVTPMRLMFEKLQQQSPELLPPEWLSTHPDMEERLETIQNHIEPSK